MLIRLGRITALSLSLLTLVFLIFSVGLTPVIVEAPNGFPVYNLDTLMDYATIQEAIDADETLDGHTIFVSSGTYYEHVTVDKSLSLLGEDKLTTIIDGNGTGRVVRVTAVNVTINGFTIRNGGRNGYYSSYAGISLLSGSNEIKGNVLEGSGVGISISGGYPTSGGNLISSNEILNNNYGIISTSDRDLIVNNTVIDNSRYGIWLQGVWRNNSNMITHNNVSGSQYGISLFGYIMLSDLTTMEFHYNELTHSESQSRDLSNNMISHNMVTDCEYGISIEITNDNMLIGNTLKMNDIGISIYHEAIEEDSNNNTIFHNNFVENTIQVFTTESTNIWDNGLEGNYWSNYNGTDLNSDGIGDIPYFIAENNTDNYPLMGMFSNFQATSEYNVQTICNSSISGFSYNGSTINFEATGEEGLAGFCRITIPTELMNETYRIFVNGTEILHTKLPVSNSTHSYLYFTYDHSTKEVVIISEFPSLLILPLFMLATLVAALVCRRKNKVSVLKHSTKS